MRLARDPVPVPVPMFMNGPTGRVFGVYRSALTPRRPRRGVLVLPPFAEEMNKTRRMVTLFAQRAQESGMDALVPDLTGTGDSTGDFRDATLDIWRGDLRAWASWLAGNGVDVLDVLAIRFGALLVGQLDFDGALEPGRLVLWQPVTSGRLLVNQFLRLRFAAGLIAGAGPVESSDARNRMRREGFLEIAGYELSDTLASALETLDLVTQPAHRFERVAWLELAAEETSELSPAATRIASAWKIASANVSARTLPGDPFWATTEIATVPALLDASLAALGDGTAGE